MSADIAAVARKVYEAFNDRDWDRAVSYASADTEVAIVPFGMTASGPEGFRQFMQSWVASSSDLKIEVVAQHVAGETITNEILATGTHDGPLVMPTGEIPASGRTLEIPVVEVWQFADGKMTSLRNYADIFSMYRQTVAPLEVEQRVRAFYEEVANGGRHDLIPEYATEDWIDHEVFPGISADREGIGQFLTTFRNAFPDLHFTVDEVLVVRDKAALRGRISGTHKGEFMGMPPTGKSFEITTMDILRMVGDRAAEHWGVTDAASMMAQLGVEPAPVG